LYWSKPRRTIMVTLNLKVIAIVVVAVYIITKYFIFGMIPILIVGAGAFWAIQKWGTVNGKSSN
jgi:predicted RND superfamily exporter protein